MLSSKKIPIEFQSNTQKYKKFHKIKLEKAIKFYSKVQGAPILTQNINFMPVKQLLSTLKIVKPVLKKINRKARLRLIT
jgi:nucleoside diphosphate kinase